MPIRVENRDRYPADWPAIAKRIKDAAGWACVGSPAFPDCRAVHGEPHPVTGSKVIITVAHLDHTPENVDDANLRAWCQKCHNTFDAPNRARGVKERRRAALAIPWREIPGLYARLSSGFADHQALRIGDPEYPAEWSLTDGGAPQCTAFALEPPPEPRCDRTPDMFGDGDA